MSKETEPNQTNFVFVFLNKNLVSVKVMNCCADLIFFPLVLPPVCDRRTCGQLWRRSLRMKHLKRLERMKVVKEETGLTLCFIC